MRASESPVRPQGLFFEKFGEFVRDRANLRRVTVQTHRHPSIADPDARYAQAGPGTEMGRVRHGGLYHCMRQRGEDAAEACFIEQLTCRSFALLRM